MELAIGVAIGLALAASGWTLTKIVSLIEAKIKTAEADALHTAAKTVALNAPSVLSSAISAPLVSTTLNG